MTLARDATLTATLLACVYLFAHQSGSRLVQVDYCIVTRKAGAFDKEGHLHTGWVQMYGPCSEQDVFRNI